MLAGIQKLIDALEKLDIQSMVQQIVLENEEIILWLIRRQLSSGVDGDDKPVTLYGKPYYAKSTIKIKSEFGVGLGSETRWITNYMSGAFYESLYVAANGKSFDILSNVPYFETIKLRSGVNITKLSFKSQQIFKDEVLVPQLNERIIAALNAY